MTDHLLTQTLAPEQSLLAAYYTRGLARQEDLTLSTYAGLVAGGSVSFSEAMDGMTAAYLRRGGDVDQLDAYEERMTKRLADAADRVQRGEPAVTVPLVVLSPLVAPARCTASGSGRIGVHARRDQRAAGWPEGRRGEDRRQALRQGAEPAGGTRRRASGASAIRSAATTSRPRPTRACPWLGHSRRQPKPV